MKGSLDMAQRASIGTLSYSPFIPLYLRGGIDTQLFNYSNLYNRNLNYNFTHEKIPFHHSNGIDVNGGVVDYYALVPA